MQHHPRNYQTKALFVEKNILFHYWQLVNGVSMSAPGKHPSPAPPSDCRYPLSPLISIKLAPSSPCPITMSTPFISLILSLSGEFINYKASYKMWGLSF
jgi:hypothetical protein